MRDVLLRSAKVLSNGGCDPRGAERLSRAVESLPPP